MRHRVSRHKLGKSTGQRMSVYRNLVADLFRYGKVVTTESRAKRVRSFADKVITLGKQGTLHSRRQVLSFVTDEEIVDKVFAEIAPRYADRRGGYSRVTKLGSRAGDAAPMAQLDLVS
ncbi:MAG: 50S ribosomal protein L17 [Chloroflexota bacterium]